MDVRPFNGNRERELVVVAYALYVVGFFGMLAPSVLALGLNYWRRDRSGSCYGSHHRWMIRTFWWGMLWAAIGFFLFFAVIGYVLLVIVSVWWVYRVIRGVLALADEQAMPLSLLRAPRHSL
ncbi:hypothetical protein [Acidiferrobacter sp.]|uniref:DUF4870 family protein n=1 Tax=Acidiferrobacter sp. TaxID=1872107 RepID=UPI00263A1804|nr:hypothetical protein [Acidiferrobacter sp.]